MNRPLVIGMAVVAAFALTGCVATLPPAATYAPPASGPTATLVLETTVTVNTRHAYVSGTGSCAGRATVQSPGEVRVPAGKPLLVQQGFFSIWVGHTKHCNIAATFIPLEGRRYVAKYQMDGKTLICAMNIWKVAADGTRMPEPTSVQASGCTEP
jgi:hypothetical protein